MSKLHVCLWTDTLLHVWCCHLTISWPISIIPNLLIISKTSSHQNCTQIIVSITGEKNVFAHVGHTQMIILASILVHARLDLEGSDKKYFCSDQKKTFWIWFFSLNLNFQLDQSTLRHFVFASSSQTPSLMSLRNRLHNYKQCIWNEELTKSTIVLLDY